MRKPALHGVDTQQQRPKPAQTVAAIAGSRCGFAMIKEKKQRDTKNRISHSEPSNFHRIYLFMYISIYLPSQNLMKAMV